MIRAQLHLIHVLVYLRSLLSYLAFRKLPPLAVSSCSLPAAAWLYLARTVKTSFFNKWYFFLRMLWPCTTEDMHLVMSSLPVSLSSRQRELSGTLKSESKPFYYLLEARFWENIDMHVVHERLLHVHECVKGYSESCQSSEEAVGCSVVCITVANQNDFRQISKGLYLLKTTSEWRLSIRTITQPENRKTTATWSKWWWVGTPNPPYHSSLWLLTYHILSIRLG